MSKYGVEGYKQGPAEAAQAGEVRKFETGATRDAETGKFDYEGFLSPIVLERYGAYMHKHRKQSDGTMRESDNWQKGMPPQVYVKSLLRHALDLWKLWRGFEVWDIRTGEPVDIEDAACAIIFNTMGFLFGRLRIKKLPSCRLPDTKAEWSPWRLREEIAREINKPANPEKWPSHRPTPIGWSNRRSFPEDKTETFPLKDYGQYERCPVEGADHTED